VTHKLPTLQWSATSTVENQLQRMLAHCVPNTVVYIVYIICHLYVPVLNKSHFHCCC